MPLSTDYGGQTNPRAITPADEALIQPYIWGKMTGYDLRDEFGPTLVREIIVNYDVIVQREKPRKIIIPGHEEYYRDPVLAESLKSIQRLGVRHK